MPKKRKSRTIIANHRNHALWKFSGKKRNYNYTATKVKTLNRATKLKAGKYKIFFRKRKKIDKRFPH